MPKKLLLADDSITIQKVVGITFAQEDYEITYTDNGEDAIKKAKEVKPDVILADIIMPQKNGYEVCEAVKADPALSHIPVLLLAGTFETFDESRGKKAGADGYIVKPFESQALIDKVNSLSSKKPQTPEPPVLKPEPVITRPVPPAPQPQFTTQAPKLEPETSDKRMEPLLEFEVPTEKAPEITVGGDIFSQGEELGQLDYTTEPPIDLASPADFIMQATSPQETFAEPVEPEPKIETPAETPQTAKVPTFDFISGESDLKPEAAKIEEAKFTGFPDFSVPEEPKEAFKIPEPVEPPFEVPSPDLGTDILASRQVSEEITQAPKELPKAAPVQTEPSLQIPEDKLEAMVRKMVQNIIEKIAWEVVPDTAERIIKEEIKRLTEPPSK